MNLLTTLKTGGRAAAVAAALSTAALVAAPAQAAPPNFNFSMQFGNGFNGGPGVYFNFGNGAKKKLCLSDKQIVWQLQDEGFRRVHIWKSKGYKVIVIARWHGDWYQLLVDRCTGKIKQQPFYFKGKGDPSDDDFKFGITLHW